MSNVVKTKSFELAKRIVQCSDLLMQQRDFNIANQLIRSGTAIGALVREAEMAESSKDFKHKMYIALKEANETDYWLDLLLATNKIDHTTGTFLKSDCQELIKILSSITKTMKEKLKKL